MADDEETGAVTLEQVRALIAGAIKGGGKESAGAGADVESQVQAAVARVHQGEKDAAAREATEQRLAALEARKAEPERRPREYRAITRRIWGSDDD